VQHTASVKMGIKKSLLVVDMPKGTYNNIKSAEKNVKSVIKKTGCDAIKIESNKKNYKIIEHLTKKKIPVMGHIGFTPQFKKKFRIEGQTNEEISRLLREALLIEKSGAFSIVLECLSPKAAKLITKKINIPTIGIGSSLFCDGQILVTDDMLGLSGFYPKFVKKYANLNRIIEKAVKKYTKDVKKNKFPTKNNFLNG
jgi:3-methyl-2-oxobutanoate hydroxymethyltransferase